MLLVSAETFTGATASLRQSYLSGIITDGVFSNWKNLTMNAQAKFSPGIGRHRCNSFSGVIPAGAGMEFVLYVKIKIAGCRVGAHENRCSAASARVDPFMSKLTATVLWGI